MIKLYETLDRIGIHPTFVNISGCEFEKLYESVKEASLDAVEIDKKSVLEIGKVKKEDKDVLLGISGIETIEDFDSIKDFAPDYITLNGFDSKVLYEAFRARIKVIGHPKGIRDAEKFVESGIFLLEIDADKKAGVLIDNILELYPEAKIVLKCSREKIEKYSKISDEIIYNVIFDGNVEDMEDVLENLIYTSLGFELAHVGINEKDEESSKKTADRFSQIFGLKTKEEIPSYFSGKMLEVMKFKGRGTNGHIAVGTYSIERAREYLKRYGVEFDESSFAIEGNKIIRAYINEEIGGFAVHLMKK